jgi:hypothetical protein
MGDCPHERTPAQTQEAQQFPDQPKLRNRRSTDVLKHSHMSAGRNGDGELGRVISMKQGRKIRWERLKHHAGARGAPLTTEVKKHRHPDGIDVLQARRVYHDRSIRIRRECI